MVPAPHDSVIRQRFGLIAQKSHPLGWLFLLPIERSARKKQSVPAAEQTEQEKKHIDEVKVQARCS